MIALIDYGVGNAQAFLNTFKRLGISARRANTVADLESASHLILPGVGAFDHAMTMFEQSGLRPAIEELVITGKKPILGICVGMQMLASGSDEGQLPGLNWIPGRVRAFKHVKELEALPLPHMGWNNIKISKVHPLFSDLEKPASFYFLHSYFFDAENKENVIATANYGIKFDCIVSHDNIYGIQCHPEKSHHFGSQFLKNFSEVI